ncbi:hypothetical protein scyTo_0008654 [Scyliorhinus torazame]|uniref:Secreted protein n=1 Tax=Scyliorhinus torazame TaxID=75743 RepID=A0A401PC82_SCYTO|nr:hypothetical protein [Scyliorhinus torazame]
MLLAVFVVAGTLAFQGVSGRRYRPPIFLEPRECLEFEVLCNVSDFQARSYNSSRWVGVPFPNVSEFRRSFRCLKRYAKGQNSQGLPILMTAQFLVSFNGSRPLSLFWLLPKNRQVNPPLPVNGSRVSTYPISWT